MARITFYTPIPTNRTRYIIKQIAEWMAIEPETTTEIEKAKESAANGIPTINYSTNQIANTITILPCGLLNETGTKREVCDEGEWKGTPTFFKTECEDVPFDLLAAVFYLISRYEEYENRPKDKHGRYMPQNSIAYKRGFLNRPIVDEWIELLRKEINRRFPTQHIAKGEYRHVPTVDVDNVYAYRNKGIIRHLIHIAADLARGRGGNAKKRIRVLMGKEDDPYFNIEEIAELIAKRNPNGIMFFHCGAYGKHDKKTIFPSRRYWRAKQKIEKIMKTGLHPSYRSADCETVLEIEKKTMERCVGRRVTECRMHYLRFALPYSAEMLIRRGFTDEYSMAYSDMPGFRAGTARPFKFFNLESEQERSLMLHPLIVMDKTLRSNLGMGTEEAKEYITAMAKKCKECGTPFVTLFHNQNMTDTEGWNGWRKLYEELLEAL